MGVSGRVADRHCTCRADRRRAPSVTAGSVAIANEFTGVYPTVSPGGWHLLGHTTETMFDVDRDKPALVMAGDRVRFVPHMIEIINQGIGSSFQDLGRLGCSHLGVGRSGAADRPSHRLANRLVGNDGVGRDDRDVRRSARARASPGRRRR